jgi:hypothetical protein
MSTVRLKERPDLNDQMLRCEHLVFSCKITHNATPADKTFAADIPSVVMLRAEGQTDAVDAVEELVWTTPADNSTGNSVFGLYLNIGKTVTPDLGPVASAEDYADKVYKVEVIDAGGTASSLSLTGPNAVAQAYLTPLGNIAIEIAATGLNLVTEDATLNVLVDYREQIK